MTTIKFEPSEKELKLIDEFIRQHKKCNFTSTTGGKITYSFTPTGLGVVTTIKCNACGKQEDVTDIDFW